MRGRYVVDDVDRDGAGRAVAGGVGHPVLEVLRHLGVGAVVGVRAGVERLGQGVDVAAVGIDLDGAEGARRRRVAAAHQRIGQRRRAARAVELVARVGLQRRAGQRARDRADRKVGPVGQRIGIERTLVHRHVAVVRRRDPAVRQVDGQRRGRGVAVAVLDGVDEHIGRARRQHHVRVAVIAVGAVRVQRQRAKAAGNRRPDPGQNRHRRVVAGRKPDHAAGRNRRRRAVRPEHVGGAVAQHVAGDNRALNHAVGVGMRGRYVVDDVDRDGAGRAVAVGVGHPVLEVLRHLGVGAVVGVRAGVERLGQGVDVAAVGIDLDGAEACPRSPRCRRSPAHRSAAPCRPIR